MRPLPARPWVTLCLVTCLYGASAGCPDTPQKPRTLTPTAVDITPAPAHFPAPIPSPARNPMTPEGVALGRHLFHEPMLSSNSKVSCATCHHPAKAFTDGQPLGTSGVSGEALKRHAPTLANVAWMPALFWDGGGSNLESQSFAPLTHPDEMGLYLRDAVKLLAAQPDYVARFDAAFDDGITIPNLVRALAQFQRTLVSASSRYDRYIQGDSQALNAQERSGEALFLARCSPCHAPPLFTDHAFHNNGLDDSYPEDDERLAWGRARITQDLRDKGAYKTPTLRNITLTAPYMHDGRFATLREVFTHYREGITPSPTLAAPLSSGLAMTDAEEEAITAFLHTLTDKTFITASHLKAP